MISNNNITQYYNDENGQFFSFQKIINVNDLNKLKNKFEFLFLF